MEATSSQMPPQSYQEQLQRVTGERFYAIGRFLILLAFLAVVALLESQPLWPISGDSPPLVLVCWAYAIFCLVLAAVLFVPPLHILLTPAVFVDMLFISALVLFSSQPYPTLFALYLLPLLSISLHYGAATGLVAGMLAAFLYGAAAVTRLYMAGGPSADMGIGEYTGLGLQALLLVLTPWLASAFMEAWSNSNKHEVDAARREAQHAQQQIEVYRNKMNVLYSVAQTLATDVIGARVLEALLEKAHHLVAYDAGMALLPTGKEHQVRVEAGHGLSVVDRGLEFQITADSLVAAAFSPNPIQTYWADDISQDSALKEVNTARNCHAACLLPLHHGMQVYGVQVVMRKSTQPFTQDDVDILAALASYATSALIRAELASIVRKDRVDLASAQEYARHHLAREIHDGLAQKLAAITMNIDFIKRIIQSNPAAGVKELDKIGELFKRANYDVRTLLGELKPTTLEVRGLPAAVEELVERYRKQHPNITFISEAKGVAGMTMQPSDKSTLYNVVQESLNNAIKYSGCTQILVRFEREGFRLTIAIQDNGKGFDVHKEKEKARARGSHGLSNLNDRAKQVMVGDKSGSAEIRSAPGKGTTVLITVPLEV